MANIKDKQQHENPWELLLLQKMYHSWIKQDRNRTKFKYYDVLSSIKLKFYTNLEYSKR